MTAVHIGRKQKDAHPEDDAEAEKRAAKQDVQRAKAEKEQPSDLLEDGPPGKFHVILNRVLVNAPKAYEGCCSTCTKKHPCERKHADLLTICRHVCIRSSINSLSILSASKTHQIQLP